MSESKNVGDGTLPLGKLENQKTGIEVLDGELVYGSGAETGHQEIILPSLPGSPNSRERLLVKDFGVHVAGKIESSLDRNPYLKSGPQQNPAQVFRHYVACAEGAQLVDKRTLGNMQELAGQFEKELDREAYFEEVIRPYLHSLEPGRRK